MALLVLINAIWIRAKLTLKARGYQAYYFRRHFADYKNLKRAIEAETNSNDRQKLRLQKQLMDSCVILIPLSFVLMFGF